jgi:hypothetical protein
VTFPRFDGSRGHERFEDIDGTLVYHTAGLLTTFFGLPLFPAANADSVLAKSRHETGHEAGRSLSVIFPSLR